jgi:prepilin-type processing-associated H-X9-DG protein
MFAVTDSLTMRWGNHAITGMLDTFPFFNRKRKRFSWDGLDSYEVQQPPQHGGYFNMLFVDGHAGPVLVSDLFDARKTASNWNCDHEPHPETW